MERNVNEPNFAPAIGPEHDQVWYTALNGKQQGPFSIAQIVGQLRNKPIDPGFLVWKPGMKEWSPILDSELHSALYTATTPPPLTAQEVANGWIWAVTLSPIWLAVIAEIIVPIFFKAQYGAGWEIAYASYNSGGKPGALFLVQLCCFVVVVSLFVADRRALRGAGWNVSRLRWWTMLVAPFYIYRRDRLVRANMLRFWLWFGAIVVGAILQS
jgi:hypothetical protein